MQQKALIIRALLMSPKVLILDEPTKGVDIGSRATIYTLLRKLAADGMAILLISSDFEELLALSHRIVPISDGQSIGSHPASVIDEEQLILLAAPRSSMQRQQAVLRRLGAQFGAKTAWLLASPDRVTCLAAGPDAPMAAGTAAQFADTPFTRALRSAPLLSVREPEGSLTLIVPVENPRGHNMGCIAFLWSEAISVTPSELTQVVDDVLNEALEGQIRVTDRKKDPNQ
jgi:ABC-type glutathione transport system ATPase component